jgi:chlorophyll synthase
MTFLTLRATPSASVVLELVKPITWFPPMWAFACGVVSSGRPVQPAIAEIALGLVLVGPLVCAAGQAINEWFDRHVDAINEPHRPIPSGRLPGTWGLRLAIAWMLASLAAASLLGPVVFGATLVGLLCAWAYSAPPLRLKQNGWLGNAACGLCYEGLAWITGAALMLGGALPDARILALAGLYSVAAHGIMTLNDFKSIQGDTRTGVRSLPVQLGTDRAAKLACAVMLAPQGVAALLLAYWGQTGSALAIGGVMIAQLACMPRLLSQPRLEAPWYGATGVSLLVTGMMVAAVAVR